MGGADRASKSRCSRTLVSAYICCVYLSSRQIQGQWHACEGTGSRTTKIPIRHDGNFANIVYGIAHDYTRPAKSNANDSKNFRNYLGWHYRQSRESFRRIAVVLCAQCCSGLPESNYLDNEPARIGQNLSDCIIAVHRPHCVMP